MSKHHVAAIALFSLFCTAASGTFLYQFTIDDPKVLTKPWTSPVARYTWSPHR